MTSGHRVAMLGTGLDRRLLHDDPARPAQPRPGRRRLLPLGRARRGVPHALGHPARRRRASRRRSTTPTSTPSSSGCPTTCTRRRSHRRRRAGKPVLCTKPLARSAEEAKRILDTRRVGRALRRLPRGPRLHAEDDQGAGRRRRRCDRRRDVGAQPGDPPRPAQRVVLGRRAGRRRVHRRPRLPLHRDHPQLRRQEATGRSR